MLRHLLLSRRAAAAKKVSGSVRASWVFFTMIQDSRGFAMVTPDRKESFRERPWAMCPR